MAILDINKNSLPEQVQENKENIAALQTAMDDKASTQYVDEKDADTLQDAKDYADEKVPKSIFTQRAGIIAGYAAGDPREIPAPDDSAGAFLRLIGTNDNKGIIWVKGVRKSDVDSETATSGQVLQADGNGGAAWATPSGSGAALLWAGSLTLSTNTPLPFTLTQDKRYLFGCSAYGTDIHYYDIKATDNPRITTIDRGISSSIVIMSCTLDINAQKVSSTTGMTVATGSNPTSLSQNITLKEVYVYD